MTKNRRAGFTLLEMILALSIGSTLLLGLYATMDYHVRATQAGRELVQEATLVRSIFARIGADMTGNLSPLDPRSAPDNSILPTASDTSTTTTNSSTTTTDGSTTSSSSTSSADTSSSDSTTTTSTQQIPVSFHGEQGRIIFTAGRFQRGFTQSANSKIGVCDLRRIAYWVVEGEGLYRQDLNRITGDDNRIIGDDMFASLQTLPQYLVASEVTAMSFEYYDGTTWQPSWDGRVLVGDAPLGPPIAVRVALTMKRANGIETTYHYVLALPTANNPLAGAP